MHGGWRTQQTVTRAEWCCSVHLLLKLFVCEFEPHIHEQPSAQQCADHNCPVTIAEVHTRDVNAATPQAHQLRQAQGHHAHSSCRRTVTQSVNEQGLPCQPLCAQAGAQCRRTLQAPNI
jgi:hypothetical protein